MKTVSTYSVKIKHYNQIFKDTVFIYRKAVDFLIDVCLNEWESISAISGSKLRQQYVERLVHATKSNLKPECDDFDKKFYKLPNYLRRSAINKAIGLVSSYMSNLNNWKADPIEKEPSVPKAGYAYPCLYKDDMYKPIDTYTAKIKVFVRNTWDWITVKLRKSDVNYIKKHCTSRKECAPTLQKRGKEWFLDFPFEENVTLNNTKVTNQTVAAVDLGINSSATVSIMHSDGTVIGRHSLKLPVEYDSLMHSINRIKKAQQHGNHRTPRLWAKAKGINHDISVKTAAFIIKIAVQYKADAIVFEHLDKSGKAKGSKKQKLKLWRSQEVQRIVVCKAHRLGMRISHVNAWGTSKLAFDGSGYVKRGKEAELKSYSLCMFSTGKVYNCDLSASYNIGARYFIRELIKSLSVKARLALEAKVPQFAKRSTCTLSTLISLNAALVSV